MKVLMSPTPAQLERLEGANRDIPRWFAAPLAAAAGGKCCFTRSLPAILMAGRSGGRVEPALVFNVESLEATLALLPLRLRLCSLYQWRPPEQLSAIKRFIYHRLLKKSTVIATYSKITQAELERRFAGKAVRWIGLFTDTEFFDPAKSQSAREPYLLCPGDHRRIEPVVSFVARELRMRVVRFSSGPETAKFYAKNPNPFVECLSGIPFSKVRDIYGSARVVLNAADDRFWPIGITTFCEALAMNRPVVTSAGHSCSGYEFEDGYKPYQTIQNCFDQEEWLKAVKIALANTEPWAKGRSPRDLALRSCSFDATMTGWKAILELLDR